MKKSRLPLFITIAVLIFLYLPVAMFILNSLNASQMGRIFTSITFKWYEKLVHERELWLALKNSLVIGISATIVSTVLGTLAALALYRYKTALQKIHYGLIYTP